MKQKNVLTRKGARGAAVLCGLLVAALLCWFPAQAQEAKKEQSFGVSSHALHYEAPQAEVCFSFTGPLAVKSPSGVLSGLSLIKNGKRIKVAAEHVSLSSEELCVQGLEHRASYQIVVRGLLAQSGERMGKAYSFSATVPDRKPSLIFEQTAFDGALSSLFPVVASDKGGGPFQILRSVNVAKAHLTLYKLEGDHVVPALWRQIKQAQVSPSEVLTFVKERGRAVFESVLVFGDKPNQEQRLSAPLAMADGLGPGLYYLAVAPQDAQKNVPALFAGRWLALSGPKLRAVQGRGGVWVFASTPSPWRPQANVPVALWSEEGEKPLAEARTDAAGLAFFPVSSQEKAGGFLVSSRNSDGFLSLAEVVGPMRAQDSPSVKGRILLDQKAYASGEMAVIALQDLRQSGEQAPQKEMVLKMFCVGAEGARVRSLAVPPALDDTMRVLTIPLPSVKKRESWRLLWEEKDGGFLAQADFVLTPDAARETVGLTLERSEDGRAKGAWVHVKDASGRPLAFVEGVMTVDRAVPTFGGFEGYSFGIVSAHGRERRSETSFVTDAHGRAWAAFPEDKALEEDLTVSVRAVLETGAVSSTETLSLKARPVTVGIRMLPSARLAAENGLVRFGVIALDKNKKRIGQDGLRFLVYEEGRSFEWFPSSGRWAYRPLAQHRRVGGGLLNLSASVEKTIEWPVGWGRYVLDIVDGAGEVVLRYPFETGRPGAQTAERVRFDAHALAFEKDRPVEVPLVLTAPAVVSLLVSEEGREHATHKALPAGRQIVTLPPFASRAGFATVRLGALFEDGREERLDQTFEVRSVAPSFEIKAALSSRRKEKAEIVVSSASSEIKSGAQAVAVLVPGAEGETTLSKVVSIGSKGMASIKLDHADVDSAARVAIVAWQKDAANITLLPHAPTASFAKTSVPVPFDLLGAVTGFWEGKAFSLPPAQTVAQNLGEGKGAGRFLLSSVALPDLAPALTVLARALPQTTDELALWLDAVRAWQAPLVGLGLVEPLAFVSAQTRRARFLLARQNEDGGFPRGDRGESDLTSTALAVSALPERYAQARAAALSWLSLRLENVWFEESERASRAFAFEALVRHARVSPAAVIYFAETSKGKALSLAAQAALASALKALGEDAKAEEFLTPFRSAWAGGVQTWSEGLGVAYRFMASHEKGPAYGLARISRAVLRSASLADTLAFLTGVAETVAHAGSWRLNQEGREQKHFGFYVPEGEGERLAQGIRNDTEETLYGYRIWREKAKKDVKPPSVFHLSRFLYNAKGETMGSEQPLRVGETYILALQARRAAGGSPVGAMPIRIVLPFGEALRFRLAPMASFQALKAAMPWLTAPVTQGLLDSVENEEGVGFTLATAEQDWLILLLLTPERPGRYALPEAFAHGDGGPLSLVQDPWTFVIEPSLGPRPIPINGLGNQSD